MEVSVGWIFILIFTVIVIGFVLVLGGQQIASLLGIGKEAQLYQEVQDLRTLTEELFFLSPGSSKTWSVRPPSGTRMCFLSTDPSQPATYTNRQFNWLPDTIVKRLLTTPTGHYFGSTVWLYPSTEPAELGSGTVVKYLETTRSFCLPEAADLFFVNQGDHVEVECSACV